MNVIIMYVVLLGQTWEQYDYVADAHMDQVVTLEDCAREGDRLLTRKGEVRAYLCTTLGDPTHSILPPYDWGKQIMRANCDVRCQLEEYDARRGKTRQ